jgi:uncharacterized OB-fold protein
MIYSAPRNGREATPHWQAARAGVLKLPFRQGVPVWPPNDAPDLEWRDCSGGGTVLSFSVVRRAVQPEWKGKEPYVIAMIALDAGVRMLSNIIGCHPADVTIGARVQARFVETTDPDLGLVVFELSPGASPEPAGR